MKTKLYNLPIKTFEPQRLMEEILKAKERMSKYEILNAERILSTNEVKSYSKLHKTLIAL